MQFFLLLMVLCLAVALGVIAVVAVGMRGMYYERNPHLARVLSEAARAFNGDARPPAMIQQIAASLDRRDLTAPASQPSSSMPLAANLRQSASVAVSARERMPATASVPSNEAASNGAAAPRADVRSSAAKGPNDEAVAA